MDQLRMDVRYFLRTLRRNPGFTFIAILVLALGIGATTAIFGVVNAVLIRPLPYKESMRLVAISSHYRQAGVSRIFPTVTLNEVERWRNDSQLLSSVGSFVFSAEPVTIGTRSMFVAAIGADPELLETLGVQPVLGRNLPGSGSKVKDAAVVISHRLWVEGFQSDPQVLGRTLVRDGAVAAVAGVLPKSFQFPRSDASYFQEAPDLIYPVANIADMWGRTSSQWFAIARLKQGVSMTAAETELAGITARMGESDPSLKGISVHLARLDSETTANVRSALLLSLGISLVLLLIACTNIMNLLFSRAAQRGREIAVRKAIGASTGRLVGQMLTESACLTFLGCALGVVLASLVLETLVRLWPAHLPVSGRVEIDWTVLGFAVLISGAAAILAGAMPALHRSRQADAAVIAASRSTGSRGLLRVQRGLMVAQIALGVGLLAAAGLLSHSLYRLSSVNPGFRTKDTLALEVAFPGGRPDEAAAHYDRILESVRGVPGIQSAGWITNPPPETRAGIFIPFAVVGSRSNAPTFCNFQVASEGYFEAAGIGLSRGRDFTRRDAATAPRVAIVNESLARQYMRNGDPVGQHITTMFSGTTPLEVVGVIRDAHDRGLAAKSIATVYLPYRQLALPYGGVVARANVRPEEVMREIRRRIARADAAVAVRNLMTIDERLAKTMDTPRFYTIMAAACATMAALFVGLGLYGVVSYAVSRRTAEIGIRMALGAERRTVFRQVLAQALKTAALGIVLGIGLSTAATRLLAALLFEIRPIDPPTLALAGSLVFVVTVVASFLPARRASLVHPIEALRHE